jgi:elongation factor G
MMGDRLGANAHPVQYPLGEGELFTGVVDIVERKSIIYEDEMGSKTAEGEVPDGLKDRIEELRHTLLEAAIEHDDELVEKYLGGAELSNEELRHAIRAATIKGAIFPVFCGSAFKNKGVQTLLDGVIDYLPSPVDIPAIQGHLPHKDETFETREASDDAPFSALAFKIATDPYVGKLTFFRVYSGSLPSGSYVYNATKERRERVGRILQMHANKREERDEVFAGDIAAAIGFKNTFTGDTLSDAATRSSSNRSASRSPSSPARSSPRAKKTRTAWARACAAWPRKTPPSAPATTRRPARRSSQAWASCTWK